MLFMRMPGVIMVVTAAIGVVMVRMIVPGMNSCGDPSGRIS